MIKWAATFVAGIALGAGAVLLWQYVLDDELAPSLQPIETLLQPTVPAHTTSGTDADSLARIQELPPGFERQAALYELLRGADAVGIEVLLDELAAPWSKGIIYSRYVELAPRAALNHLISKEGHAARLFSALLASWAREDLDGALAFAETLPEPARTAAGKSFLFGLGDLIEGRRDEIARRLSVETQLAQTKAVAEARADPAGVWPRALAMKPGQSRTDTLWAVAWYWLDRDPAAALSALDAIDDAGQRDQWQRRLLEEWAGRDRESALQWLVSQPRSQKRTTLLGQVAASGAKDSPAGMLEFARTLDPKEGREVAARVLGVWANSDPRAALAALEQMDDRRLTQMTQHTLFDAWARSDPLALLEWARTRPASDGRTQALAVALGRVGESDPADAMVLAEDLDAGARSNAIERVIRRWARDDPRAAADWLDASSHKNPGVVAAVVSEYAALDAREAFDWLQTQSAEAQRWSAARVVGRVAEDSPEDALKLIDRIEDPATASVAGAQLISEWTRDDPRAAVRAIARVRDDSRPQLYQAAFGAWSRLDPGEASAFLDQIPASSRDAAISGVLQQTLFAGNVQSAEELFDRIVDTETRRAVATTMYFHFSRTDPTRAERYREMSGVEIGEDGSITVTLPAPNL